MKASVFRQKLLGFAEQLAMEDDHRQAQALRILSVLFEGGGNSSVAITLRGKRAGSPRRSNAHEPTAADTKAALSRFQRSLPPKDRRSATKDFATLTELLSVDDSASIPALVASVRQFASKAQPKSKRKLPVKQILVDTFLKRLEDSLGDPQAFKAIFEELDAHPEIGQPEAVALARAFMGRTAASVTRKAALDRILSRHLALMDFRAKRKAFGGRTAA